MYIYRIYMTPVIIYNITYLLFAAYLVAYLQRIWSRAGYAAYFMYLYVSPAYLTCRMDKQGGERHIYVTTECKRYKSHHAKSL